MSFSSPSSETQGAETPWVLLKGTAIWEGQRGKRIRAKYTDGKFVSYVALILSFVKEKAKMANLSFVVFVGAVTTGLIPGSRSLPVKNAALFPFIVDNLMCIILMATKRIIL